MGRFESTLDIYRPTKEIAMLDELKMIESVAPDIIEVLQERYKILRNIYWMQPIGRRSLSESMGITERVLRTETDLLKQLNLINTSKSGMTLTKKGEEVYQSLESFMDQLLGMHQSEKNWLSISGINVVLSCQETVRNSLKSLTASVKH